MSARVCSGLSRVLSTEKTVGSRAVGAACPAHVSRVLLIHWESPGPLETFLAPSEIDWRLTPELNVSVADAFLMHEFANASAFNPPPKADGKHLLIWCGAQRRRACVELSCCACDAATCALAQNRVHFARPRRTTLFNGKGLPPDMPEVRRRRRQRRRQQSCANKRLLP